MLELFQAGGPFMWVIALCSIIAAAIVAERLWTLQQRRVMPQDLTRRIWTLVENGQVNEKVIAALESNSPLGKILAAGLQHRHRPRDRRHGQHPHCRQLLVHAGGRALL